MAAKGWPKTKSQEVIEYQHDFTEAEYCGMKVRASKSKFTMAEMLKKAASKPLSLENRFVIPSFI